MASALEVDPNMLIERVAVMLKEQKLVTPPAWSGFVKTGRHVERPPVERDWYYMRSAAVLRSVYKLGPIGTSKLRTKYGGKKNRGYKPERFYKGSGAIIRNTLQQLEKIGFLAKADKGPHKGRKITPKGMSFLDKVASQMLKERVKAAVAEESKHE